MNERVNQLSDAETGTFRWVFDLDDDDDGNDGSSEEHSSNSDENTEEQEYSGDGEYVGTYSEESLSDDILFPLNDKPWDNFHDWLMLRMAHIFVVMDESPELAPRY